MTSTNARMFLWLGLVLALWLNYETWQRDYAVLPPPAVTTTPAPSANEVTGLAASVPQAAIPSAGDASSSSAAVAAAVEAPSAPAAPTSAASTVKVVTDVLNVEVSLRGGDLVVADLTQYPLVKGEDTRVRLLNTNPSQFYLLQTGLTGAAGETRPTHLADFEAAQTEYQLSDGADELRVPLVWRDAESGVTVTKTYVFRRGQYRIDLRYDVENAGASAWRAASYACRPKPAPASKNMSPGLRPSL
ncbi:MAG: membrane protein insertase YidC, partial [Steroidobacteraceae bacterium]